jgi:hypothetical protein
MDGVLLAVDLDHHPVRLHGRDLPQQTGAIQVSNVQDHSPSRPNPP